METVSLIDEIQHIILNGLLVIEAHLREIHKEIVKIENNVTLTCAEYTKKDITQ